jgi:hypothetical protein
LQASIFVLVGCCVLLIKSGLWGNMVDDDRRGCSSRVKQCTANNN